MALKLIDPDHSRVLFRIDHLGLSSSLGTFAKLDGEFRFDEGYWKSAHVEVSIPLDSLNLSDADWRRKVLEDYLKAGEHPDARFESTMLVPDDGRMKTGRLSGQLTLNGVTRPVELQLRFNGSNKGIDPCPATAPVAARTAREAHSSSPARPRGHGCHRWLRRSCPWT